MVCLDARSEGTGTGTGTNIQNCYTVMQSDRNTFNGDVVLDSFNKVSREEDNILDQKYKKQILRIFIMKILHFESD